MGVVHHGMLDIESSRGHTMLDVVIKLAFEKEQQTALKNEYEIYCLLRSKGVVNGIATVLGLFNDFEGGPSALVMLYAGGSLDQSSCCQWHVWLFPVEKFGIPTLGLCSPWHVFVPCLVCGFPASSEDSLCRLYLHQILTK